MARDFFHLVAQIIAQDKYVDVSVNAVVRAVRSPQFKPQFTRELVTKDYDGSDVSVSLTVNVGGSPDYMLGWSAALIMHDVRIDGIDHEFQYTAMNGDELDGWHRHVWDGNLRSADLKKSPIDGFDDCATMENFLFRVSRAMKITWNGADNADLFEVER